MKKAQENANRHSLHPLKMAEVNSNLYLNTITLNLQLYFTCLTSQSITSLILSPNIIKYIKLHEHQLITLSKSKGKLGTIKYSTLYLNMDDR